MSHIAQQRMLPAGFLMAMRGSLAEAPYGAPHRSGPPRPEWLILCRWGEAGEFLTIGRAGPAEGPEDAPPPLGLRPHATLLGLGLAAMGEGDSFLLVRYLPPGLTVAGTFHPSDGIVRLSGPASVLRLEAAGRYAHRRAIGEAGEQRLDLPDPAKGVADALAWRLDARRVPWLGEFLAPGGGAAH
ncbi:hypothetical protein [Belnapia rosea]|uniref:Uncharacterized protein n=1 Tax=Belnapia rosea TaxID=938405 RepID=A0A1G6ZNG7_9PROT|nr:hypothetical protein [Belnapia rosea]SDE03385.1 hypothetical protein SAMN04487779_10176 [Belnapia rosea]